MLVLLVLAVSYHAKVEDCGGGGTGPGIPADVPQCSRMKFDANVSQEELNETYLVAFQATVQVRSIYRYRFSSGKCEHLFVASKAGHECVFVQEYDTYIHTHMCSFVRSGVRTSCHPTRHAHHHVASPHELCDERVE